ncbi:unnamed protein product [Ambrosiozyma monospora]|uniref:Unnamed protein product n=1 Tax=Ambrosiozyma monospora TaxID=43982 RepID=A0ACB5SZX7_AMBMO|nr:unnamed protein product [Ambrosiozyma monospora]
MEERRQHFKEETVKLTSKLAASTFTYANNMTFQLEPIDYQNTNDIISWFYQALATGMMDVLTQTLKYNTATRELLNTNDVSSIIVDEDPRATFNNLGNAKSPRCLHPNFVKYLEFLTCRAN